ncbi:hypothetical protein D3C80_1492550 [compost metagenome]
MNVCGNRRIAVFRKLKRCLGDEQGARKDVCDDRKRIDAGVKHAKTARLPDPCLVGVPVTHVFFPDDVDAVELGRGEEGLGSLNRRGIT